MSDPLTDLINDVQHNGVRWVTLVTIYAMYRKERRNYLLNKRDAANFANQYEVMKALGVGDKWKDGPKFGYKPMDLPNLRRFFLLSHKDTKHQKRRVTRMQFLRSNISKKLLALLVGVGVTALNKKFNLQLSPDETLVILLAALGYITGQSYVDGKKAIASTVKAVSQAVQASSSLPPDTTYQDLFPKVKVVHEGLTKIYADIQKNDGSQAFRDSSQVYNSLYDIFQSLKPPVTIPEVVEQVSA